MKTEQGTQAGKHRLKPILIITLILAGACIFAEGQRWRNGELTEANLQAAAEVSVLQQLNGIGQIGVLNTRIDNFQKKTFGTEVKFTGRMTIYRGDFSLQGVWFAARGPVQIRFSGWAYVAEDSAFVAGVELKKLRYLKVFSGIELDDPKRHADRHEIAWREEGREAEWLYDLSIPSVRDENPYRDECMQMALALRYVRREKRFYEAIEVLKRTQPMTSGVWADRVKEERRKLIAELKDSPEFRPTLLKLGYLP